MADLDALTRDEKNQLLVMLMMDIRGAFDLNAGIRTQTVIALAQELGHEQVLAHARDYADDDVYRNGRHFRTSWQHGGYVDPPFFVPQVKSEASEALYAAVEDLCDYPENRLPDEPLVIHASTGDDVGTVAAQALARGAFAFVLNDTRVEVVKNDTVSLLAERWQRIRRERWALERAQSEWRVAESAQVHDATAHLAVEREVLQPLIEWALLLPLIIRGDGEVWRSILTLAKMLDLDADIPVRKPEPKITHQAWMDAAEAVDIAWYDLMNANTITSQANAVISLSNAMSDLRTWVMGYDVDTDTLPWQREEQL